MAMASPQEIARSLDGYTSRIKGAAVIVGIVDDGNVKVYQSGDLGEGRPKLDETTIFQIGSVTKTFTTTLLASMVIDGQVRLEDPLQAYLPPGVRAPEFHGRPITLLDLAEQNSGLPRLPENLGDDNPSDPYANYTPGMLATFLSHYVLTRVPGETYEYSNLGVGLLGDALARRAHESYGALSTRRILQPLNMFAPVWRHSGILAAGLSRSREAGGDVTIYTYRIRLGGAAREWSVGLAPDGKIAGSLLH